MSSEVGMSRLTDDELIEAYALNCDCEGTRVMLNGLRAVADAAVAAYVPEGYALVPIEPTTEMREAFNEAQEEWDGGGYDSPDHQWAAMLSAAPMPNKEPK